MEQQESGWLNIVDYAQYRGVSISTVRRYIKGNKVKYKLEEGRYFIYSSKINQRPQSEQSSEILRLRLENQRLDEEVKTLRQEVAEMKMLINIYESNKLPEIPC